MLSKSPAFTDEQWAACLEMVKSLMTSPRTSYEDFQAIGPAAGVPPGPEFGDHRAVRNQFGLSRSHLYALLAEGKIRSACIRRKGAARGRRIFDLASIRRFVEANVEAKE